MQYINKLPAVFQTVTEKKFFDATMDQVFSKKDSDYLAGFLGRREPGRYNPISDFYIPEPSKNRTWWQLEATAFARNPDTTRSNIYFYEDLLNRIEYYDGNTLNQDRLFESEYYSFGPPIDYDMFINYQNYYWVEQGLPVITITGVLASDIIGQPSYTTPITADPPNLTLTTGMNISLPDDPDYGDPHYVENFGGCIGIKLVEHFPDFTAGTIFEFLPWDGQIELSNGRVIDNRFWDATTWDTQTQPSSGDYITIERGALDRNAWSRTNKWFHIDAINATIQATGTGFPVNATRALRPIIQFIADIPLYKSGTQFRSEINYGFRDDLFGIPLRRATYQGQQLSAINNEFDIQLRDGDIVGFFNDDTEFNFWDIEPLYWDVGPPPEWDAGIGRINQFLYQVVVALDGTVDFAPYTSWNTPVLEGDIVFVLEDGPWDAAQRGQTWYYSLGVWQKAFNDKIYLNQAPLFVLYDHNGIELDDPVTYPGSDFQGSEIFSYKINTEPGATVDPVLRFPIVYTSLRQASDIMFQNDLITERYVYGTAKLNIDGYYYYKTTTSPVLYNNWNLYQPCPCDDIVPPPPCNCLETSKQRVIDKFVVGYGSEFQFKLSVTPYGYPASPDIVVSVNGTEVKNVTEQVGGYTFVEINNRIYVDLTTYLTNMLLVPQSQPPVVETQTYTWQNLDPAEPGYFEIPQQLEANPSQEEVSEISASDLTQHFSSIIAAQIGFTGSSFGGDNNYRDTRKNRSLGMFILQNVSPLLKTMLVSSSDDLDFIKGLTFSQDEYTKFKNKYLQTALLLINNGFNPVQYYNNSIVISLWVEEILKMVNVSKEFSNAFAYSYMIANGSPFSSETFTVPMGGLITLANYVDLNDPKNALYVYDTTGNETLLTIGVDYEIVSTNLSIDVQINVANVPVGNSIYVALYKNPLPAYIPSTPSKIGAYGVYLPRIELDTSYVIPTNVIIGHDGSKTIAYGDYRDQLLLELEKRIYNLIQYRFRHQHYLPIRLEDVKPGYFRQTRYTREEYLDITESYLNKWSAKNRANYRANDWVSASMTAPMSELWKLYNYTVAEDATTGAPLNLPGNWKGIFQYYYDTYYPDTRPWEMLGFSEQPSWWTSEYGLPVLNLAGQEVWPSTAAGAHNMYADLEAGIIRQGPTAVYDPITLTVQPNPMWARPGLSSIIPVDAAGEIISVMTLFNVVFSGNPFEPFDGFDNDWTYGDGSPVEQAWMSTSSYAFTVQEILMLTRPAPYGELMWDTIGTELSPGMIIVPDSAEPVMSNTNWQFVQNDTYTNADPFFAWMRPKNKDQIVHAETVDETIQVRFGYQRWISDRILFLGKSVGDTFGQKIRTLDVNLANKLAGFTNKDTTNTYIESISPGATTNTLIIPSNNFEVVLHKSPPVDTYSYSGVIIRALADGTFVVYGYDLINSEFITLDRSNAKLIEVTVGGTPAEFLYFAVGTTYKPGDIVRYNGVYYLNLQTQVADSFVPARWKKLNGLPVVGGIEVSYKPISAETITKVPYGTVFKTAQDVFDFLISWGAWLETQGWKFDEVNQDTNQLSDWLNAAKQYLFWLNTNWAPDASIQLSPLANKAVLEVKAGYPENVETLSNGVYSILDKFGVAIAPNNTSTDRNGRLISVEPTNLATGGIYYLQINTTETEHVLIFDNETSFSDVVYSPLLRARQERLRFNGFRSNGWYGKMEAPGYLIIENELVPNYDTIVEAMRYYYDPNVTIDNPSLEDLGRHLIGYESKSYLDNLQVSNDVQYLFYQGMIREKGTKKAFEKLFRSTKVQSNEIIEVYEEWALKLGEFGNTIDQVSTEFILKPEQNTGEVVVARLSFVPSKIGFVRQINILNAQNTYTKVPKVIIYPPDADPTDPALTEPLRIAKAYVVLDSNGRISRVDVTDPGYGYLEAPYIEIDSGSEPHNLDKLYSVWQGSSSMDETLDNVINIDIDQVNKWIMRPNDPQYSLTFPTTNKIDYATPNAGYVSFNDVDWYSFDTVSTAVQWGTTKLNPTENETLWVAKTFTEDWDVYKLIDVTAASGFDVFADAGGDLYLKTDLSYLITPETSTTGNQTDFGNLLAFQVIEAQAITYKPEGLATIQAVVPVQAQATTSITGGQVTAINITQPGVGLADEPTVTISPPPLVQAVMTPVMLGGKVVGMNIVNGGSGYVTAPTITIQSPASAATATATINPTNGTISLTLVDGGTGYASTPTVTIAPPTHGPIQTAVGVATLGISGQVSGAYLTNPGKEYWAIPSVTVTNPTGTAASGIATVNMAGQITGVTITNPGYGYTSAPGVNFVGDGVNGYGIGIVSGGYITGVTITDPGFGYTVASALFAQPYNVTAYITADISGGEVVGLNVLNPGYGYTAAPSLTISAPTFSTATATATISGGSVTAVNIGSPGLGYNGTPPTVTIAAPPGANVATATAIITNGVVTGYTITNQGSGYIFTPTVTIDAPTGTGATAIPEVTNGVLTGLSITNPGSGYGTPPSITIEAPVGAGTVREIEVLSSGFGYDFTPQVFITGDGIGASATAVVVDGVVTQVVVNNPGSGYTSAVATLATTDGKVREVIVTKKGMNYLVPPEVQILDNGVTFLGATAKAIVYGGQVTSIEVLTEGSGYTNPIVIIAPPPEILPDANYALAFQYDFSDTDYNYYKLVNLDGVPLTGDDVTVYADFTKLMLYKSMRFVSVATGIPVLDTGTLSSINIVSGGEGYQVAPTVLINGDGIGASATAVITNGVVTSVTVNNAGSGYTFMNVSFMPPDNPSYVVPGDKIWIDNMNKKWAVLEYNTTNIVKPQLNPFRTQEPLINSSLFQSARVFATRTKDELVLLPIFDPFKDILPGAAKQNISYISMQDPARYNVTGNERLYSSNITFGEAQVGQLWWDTSSARYVYYEQPIALDGSETEVDNLVYRRDRWGQLFPGSTIAVYEWVKSPVPPAEYTGTGIPRNTDNYVQLVTSNRFTSETEINYYFWVLGATDKPNVENRTIPALDVTRLLESPKSQNFIFFCPIQQTATNNSYMFYNVLEILSYRGDNIQIQYRLTERDDQEHVQWALFREGDPNSIVTDQFWNKMVDSLCGYTKVLPVSAEYENGIIVAKDLPWDIYGWDISLWDSATATTSALYGEILPVPDPMLTEDEKYGIQYRPRQGMFIKLLAARKIFVQAGNSLLKHIPIRDDDPGWNSDVNSDVYWKYTNWYAVGFENAVPTSVFQTLTQANAALVAGQLQVGDIVQVTNGTVDNRFVLYNVVQINPNIPVLSFEEVGIENSAIELLDTIYTVTNHYGLSVELRELLNAFRTKVMVNTYKVDQNELFFSLVNYVLSEQKNPDWVFKSSYIYIKENNLPLSQERLYVPDQIDNIIKYITDVKPYHTQIRDYTSTYVTTDIAPGTAIDSYKINTVLTFGPANTDYTDPGHWDAVCDEAIENITEGPWEIYAWDVCPPPVYVLNAQTFIDNIEQFVSEENVYTVPLTFFDSSKIGYSQLFPYTFDFNSLNLNNPQTFITPYNIVGVQIGTEVLIYGRDYFVEYNGDTTYTAYFYNNPGTSPVPVALVWFDGGGMQPFKYNTSRNEVAYGFPKDDLVINVDTKLPVNDAAGPLTPYVAWGDVWEEIGNPVAQALIDAGGQPEIPWDTPLNPVPVLLDNTISSKENTNPKDGANFYRNAHTFEGILVNDLPAPTSLDENLYVITVFVDPLTHPAGTDILPNPGPESAPGVIWVQGERIEYRMKELVAPNTWELRLVRRGTMGTAPTEHLAMIPSLADPLILVPNPVWVEKNNYMPVDANAEVWNVLTAPAIPNPATEGPVNEFTSVTNVPVGGLWYSYTVQANFLKQEQGNGIP